MDKQDFCSLILYYGRAKFFNSMQKAALDGLAKYPGQVEFRFFNGIALTLGCRVQEAIRELNPVKNEQDLCLAVIIALVYSHKRCNVTDRDALAALEQKLKDERRNLSANSAYYAAVFLFLTDKIDKARDYADKALKINESLDDAIVLKVWIQLAQDTQINSNVRIAIERVLKKGKNIDASLAEVRYFQLSNDFESALSVLNRLSVRFPELNIPLIEKMDTQMAASDWDHAFETAIRIINLEPTNISALRVKALVLICREGNIKAGTGALQQLLSVAERVEAGNSRILLKLCKLFSRLCSRNKEILNITHTYVTKVVRTNFDDVENMTELGYHNILLGYNKEAVKCFRSATKIDNNFFLALCGLTLCQILDNGSLEQARQQIEFLRDIKGIERSPLLLFLISKVTGNVDKSLNLLVEATEIHLNKLAAYTFGAEYLLQLDPDFLLEIVASLMKLSSGHVQAYLGLNSSRETLQIHFKHCNLILEAIIRACPAHLHAIFMKAKIEFYCSEYSMAVFSLNRIITSVDETFVGAYLLLSQIQIQQKQFTKALQSLEICLSHNFSVRDNPLYRLLFGIIQKEKQQYSEAQKSFLCALQLIGSSFGGTDTDAKILKSSAKARKVNVSEIQSEFSLSDKATLYLELIDVYNRLEQNDGAGDEGERLLHIALDEFNNTPLEGRLVLAHAKAMVQKGNISKAIDLLTEVQPSQLYYTQAKTQLAYIYLYQKKDRVTFAKCFKQLVESSPKPETYVMLGEAYMSIQEPDLAVDAYQTALQMNPNDSLLAGKLGRAYVKTHQYNAAVKYYHEALKNPDHTGLKVDLAELYLKLKQYQKAADVLADPDDTKNIDDNDLDGIQFYTKQLLLLARIHEKYGNINLSLKTLRQARDNQLRVFKRILVEKTANPLEQNKMLAKICFLMAQQHTTLRENDQALLCFKECLKYSPSDPEVLVPLARLYMQVNSMDLCRDVCSQILHMDSNNEAASVMMADISFRKLDLKNAAYHFSQLLISQPCYWTALARLIEVMRRSGTLSEIVPFLQRAEQSAPNILEAGLNYCKGLNEWYCGNPNGALKYFNAVRRHYEWGQQALFNMISICINPDGDLPSVSDSLDGVDGGEFNESRIIALRTAERLLKELHPHPGGLDNEALSYRMLYNFLQLASKHKAQIESALQDFTDLAAQENYQNLVGPILGMAMALVQLKQTQRAKNQLKRIARAAWNFEEAEYLERSWLLLADIYIHANKLDVADSFVRKVLEHNRSCIKAYEFAGFIAEKNQGYREAAKYYQNAWVYGGRSKPHMGYKLAYNYMKVKRYADAVDICQQVIRAHPDYIVIRKDILDKCRNYLRA